MKLSQPKKAVFNWSLTLAVVGAVCFIASFLIAPIAGLLGYLAFGLVAVAFVLLTLGVALKGF